MRRLVAFLSRYTQPRTQSDQLPALRRAKGRKHKLRRRALFLEPLEERRVLATFTVNTLADTVDADPAITSLREAIISANSQAGDDIINFSITGVINLDSALPDLSSNIQIKGPG